MDLKWMKFQIFDTTLRSTFILQNYVSKANIGNLDI